MMKRLEEKLSKQNLYCNMQGKFDPCKQQQKKTAEEKTE